MLNRYFIQLRAAFTERRSGEMPGAVFIIVAVAIFTLAYIFVATILVPANEPLEFQFVNEHGAITTLSALYLAAAGAFSFTTFVVLIRVKESHKFAWLVLALGFGFLAFDELLQFHERVGFRLAKIGGTGLFRSWNDIIVVLYGVVALPILIVILPGLLRWRFVLEMFSIAFGFYAFHTVVDSISEPPSTASIIVEESAKLFCGAFLLIGTFIGFVGVVWKSIGSESNPINS